MEKPLIQLNICPTPPNLEQRVITELRGRERKKERNRAMSFVVLSLASLSAFVPAFENLRSAAVESGFANYASLVFSDWSAVLEEREGHHTEAVVARQLDAVIAMNGVSTLGEAILACEPVWAIGTGQMPRPNRRRRFIITCAAGLPRKMLN